MADIRPQAPGTAWIDELTDDQCLEVLWLYLEDPDAFFAQHPKKLLGQALRYALHAVVRSESAEADPPQP